MTSLLVAFILTTQYANAKIRRVNYWGIPITGIDYSTLQSAHDASLTGDTLLLFPGAYAAATFKKRLVVFGYGYFLNGAGKNDSLQTIVGDISLDIALFTGSDSTLLEGLGGLTLRVTSGIPLRHILIKRCLVENISYRNARLSDWQITQSYVKNITNAFLSRGAIFADLLVTNSFIATLDLRQASSSSTGVFRNDIFGNDDMYFNGASFTIVNSIFISAQKPSGISQCIFKHDIATNNTIPSDSTNKITVSIQSVFVGYPTQGTYSSDGRFALSAGSPAIKAGEGQTDCGIFGGPTPYHLSGIPSIPSIYKLTAPTTTATTNPYKITFSVRSNN